MLLDDQRALRTPVSLSPSFSVPPAWDPPLGTHPAACVNGPFRVGRCVELQLPRWFCANASHFRAVVSFIVTIMAPIRGDIDPSPSAMEIKQIADTFVYGDARGVPRLLETWQMPKRWLRSVHLSADAAPAKRRQSFVSTIERCYFDIVS